MEFREKIADATFVLLSLGDAYIHIQTLPGFSICFFSILDTK